MKPNPPRSVRLLRSRLSISLCCPGAPTSSEAKPCQAQQELVESAPGAIHIFPSLRLYGVASLEFGAESRTRGMDPVATMTCPNCGAALALDVPQGLCPKCLLAAAAA